MSFYHSICTKIFSFITNIKKKYIIILIIFFLINIPIYKQYKKNELNRKILSLLPYQQIIINNYLINVDSKYTNEREKEALKLISLLQLLNYSEILIESSKNELKNKLLKELEENHRNKNLSQIKYVYVDKSYRFGNSMVLLNNLLYYCEILNVTNIYLNSEEKWPLSKSIVSNKINITLISKTELNFKNRNFAIFNRDNIYFQRVFKPEIRIELLKKDIKKNLPKIELDPNDLYIHIRSGDIFKYKYHHKNANYAQPPLCFYKSVLNNFKFKQIFIISEDKKNPIIDILLKEFPEIIFNINNLEHDVSILTNAYNIVGSISSFLTTLIIINENLKFIWEFDLYMSPEKYLHLHHDIYNYQINYSIYRMKPSLNYQIQMFPWINSKKQINLMLNEKCENFQLVSFNKNN